MHYCIGYKSTEKFFKNPTINIKGPPKTQWLHFNFHLNILLQCQLLSHQQFRKTENHHDRRNSFFTKHKHQLVYWVSICLSVEFTKPVAFLVEPRNEIWFKIMAYKNIIVVFYRLGLFCCCCSRNRKTYQSGVIAWERVRVASRQNDKLEKNVFEKLWKIWFNCRLENYGDGRIGSVIMRQAQNCSKLLIITKRNTVDNYRWKWC